MNFKKFINQEIGFRVQLSLPSSFVALDLPLFSLCIGYAIKKHDGGMPYDISYSVRPELTITIDRFWRKDDRMKK